jgi:MFS family permease
MTGNTWILGRLRRISESSSTELLSIRSFRAYFLGNLTNTTGVEMRVMAQSWLGGSQVMVGAAIGLRFIPAIIIGLMAGVWVDRLGGRFVLLWERGLLLGLAAVTAALVLTDTVTVWHVVLVSVISSTLMSAGAPAMHSMVTYIVPRSSLRAANSLNQLSMSSARMLGPMGAGFLLAAYGLGSPWLALIGLYAISVAATWTLPKSEPKTDSGESVLASIKSGIKYVKSDLIVRRIMLLAFSAVFAGAITPIIIVYARDRFDAGETGLGMMMAAGVIGSAIGAGLIASIGGRAKTWITMLLTVATYSAAMIVFGFSTNFLLPLVMVFFTGITAAIWITVVVTLLQTVSDPKMLGRVMSLYVLSIQTYFLSAMIGAWVGQQIGNDIMLVLAGVGFFGMHAILMVMSPALRKV